MPDYRKLSSGETTNGEDPRRGVWYTAGACGYWTDDWSKLNITPFNVPCCPICGMVGMQISAQEWYSGAQNYEDSGHAHYVAFVDHAKEKCVPGEAWLKRYEEFKDEHERDD